MVWIALRLLRRPFTPSNFRRLVDCVQTMCRDIELLLDQSVEILSDVSDVSDVEANYAANDLVEV